MLILEYILNIVAREKYMVLSRNDKWIEDIDLLASELPNRHKNLFFNKSKEEFLKEIKELKRKIKNLDEYEIRVNLAKIVAAIRDAHTGVILPVNFLCPIELYCFKDEIYIISTIEKYKHIENCKIVKVNGMDIKEVITVLSSIVSYENEALCKAQLPKYFPAIEFLYGLEIIDTIDCLELTIEDRNKKIKNIEIESLPIREVRKKLKESKKSMLKDNSLPLYRKNFDKYYWYEYMEEFKVVYFKYNACKEMEDKSVFDFGKELMKFINENQVDKLVIDLRNNAGGNSTLLEPFIEDLKACDKINKKGNLFVIVGRETFSSALLNVLLLKEDTNAIFLGEATGGKPNCYGEVERFTLKNSGLTVCYSTKYYKIITDDSLPSFYPEVSLDLTIENYIKNEDPFLDYVLKFQ